MDVVFSDKRVVKVSDEAFDNLVNMSPVRDCNYVTAPKKSRRIQFTKLVELADKMKIPYSLFFASSDVVLDEIDLLNRKILSSVPKNDLQINSRQRVEVADISLIIKDFSQKLALIKKVGIDLPDNTLHNCLKRISSAEEAAEKLRQVLGYDTSYARTFRQRRKYFDYLVELLGEKNVFVSESQPNVMLQQLKTTKDFSGFVLRDRKSPYIFLTGGAHDDFQEPEGRKIFTLMLLVSSFARGKFVKLMWNSGADSQASPVEYQIASAFLMPFEEVAGSTINDIEDIKKYASHFNVTPSAFTMRCKELGIITSDAAVQFFTLLKEDAKNKRFHYRTPRPEKKIIRYASPKYVEYLLQALDAKRLSVREFRRIVCLNKLTEREIDGLREVLR